jgi:hypothetical protein
MMTTSHHGLSNHRKPPTSDIIIIIIILIFISQTKSLRTSWTANPLATNQRMSCRYFQMIGDEPHQLTF